MRDVVRVGGGAGFFLDSAISMLQFLKDNPPDYIFFDHMAEGMMSPYLMQMQQSPDSGYSTSFIDVHVGPYLREIMAAGVKIISNAGGLNPHGAARALQKRADELGLKPKIAVVTGDDITSQLMDLKAAGIRDMFTNEAWPDKMLAGNAYFGGFPIAKALEMGADIVITGRVVDSGLALGPLIHEFGWKPTDYNKLAAGTAMGHLLECGNQCTGGTFTDWLDDVPDWDNLGYPIAECRADGTFVVTKPEGTGGLVSVGTVAEQLLYEVGDPAAYLVPDVACDFTTIKLREVGKDRVEVSNTTGRAPSGNYKVCAMMDDGWKGHATVPVLGINAVAKAEKVGNGILARTKRLLDAAGLPPPRHTRMDVLGSGNIFAVGPARNMQVTEAAARIAFMHDDVRAVKIFINETLSPSCAGAPGSIPGGGTMMAPYHRLFMFLLSRDRLAPTVTLGDKTATLSETSQPAPGPEPDKIPPNTTTATGDSSVPLIALAWGRSGDKGNLFNVGVIARKAEYLPYIRTALTVEAVADWMKHTFDDPSKRRVTRYDVPGINALNFVVHEALEGGLASTMRLDSAAKGMAQQLLQIPIPVPQVIARKWDGTRLAA